MAELHEAPAGSVPEVRSREIARRRGARDLWVSRSHVAAAAAGALALALTTFGGGYLLGRSRVAPTPSHAALTAELPREELLDLLARIDGNSAGAGASQEITFPDALRGLPSAVPRPIPAVGDPRTTTLPPVPGEVPPASSGTGFAVVVASGANEAEAEDARRRLAAIGLDTWIATDLVDGVARYRVVLGRHDDEAGALEAVALLSGLAGVSVEPLVLEPPPPPPVEAPPEPTVVEEPPTQGGIAPVEGAVPAIDEDLPD